MNDEKKVYIQNKKKGKLLILLGAFISIFGGIYIAAGVPKLGAVVFIIGLGIMISGKLKHWFHN